MNDFSSDIVNLVKTLTRFNQDTTTINQKVLSDQLCVILMVNCRI